MKMVNSDDIRSFLFILGTFLLFIAPAIVLLAIAPTQTVVSNTHGFIVPGGDCNITCGGIGYLYGCGALGTVNVSFYIPGTDQLTSAVIDAPYFCESVPTTDTICCQKYIQDNLTIWVQAEPVVDNNTSSVSSDDGSNYVIEYIGLHRISNNSVFLVLGVILAVLSIFPAIGLVCIGCNIRRKRKLEDTYYQILN